MCGKAVNGFSRALQIVSFPNSNKPQNFELGPSETAPASTRDPGRSAHPTLHAAQRTPPAPPACACPLWAQGAGAWRTRPVGQRGQRQLVRHRQRPARRVHHAGDRAGGTPALPEGACQECSFSFKPQSWARSLAHIRQSVKHNRTALFLPSQGNQNANIHRHKALSTERERLSHCSLIKNTDNKDDSGEGCAPSP